MTRCTFHTRHWTAIALLGAWASVPAAPIAGQGTWEKSLLARDWEGNGRGVDAYYDPFLDITWLADANYAKTSAYDDNGHMQFGIANAWAAGLTLFGGSDWRLPTTSPVSGAVNFVGTFSNNGSTDYGTAKTGVGWGENSEMGYMHYVHLGNKGYHLPDDMNPRSDAEQIGWWMLNTGPFSNLGEVGGGPHPSQSVDYWTNVVFAPSPAVKAAFSFDFGNGYQVPWNSHDSNYRAWAVHPGDLIGPPAPVPLPGAVWLFGSALVGLFVRARVGQRGTTA